MFWSSCKDFHGLKKTRNYPYKSLRPQNGRKGAKIGTRPKDSLNDSLI